MKRRKSRMCSKWWVDNFSFFTKCRKHHHHSLIPFVARGGGMMTEEVSRELSSFFSNLHNDGPNYPPHHHSWISVPVHKVDDITHVNFSDRDHLWFDPNWKPGSANSSANRNNNNLNHDSGEEDPMAAMLENNAKNTNAANIFVNKLHGLVTASEYAEVNHANVMGNRTSSQGPYATTNLIEPSNVSVRWLFPNTVPLCREKDGIYY